MLRLKRKIIDWFTDRLLIFGCRFEWELPPEFIITNHALQRMIDRQVCVEEKVKVKAARAWFSKKGVNIPDRYKKPYYQYRRHQGFVYVFSTRFNRDLGFAQKVLVTVMPEVKTV